MAGGRCTGPTAVPETVLCAALDQFEQAGETYTARCTHAPSILRTFQPPVMRPNCHHLVFLVHSCFAMDLCLLSCRRFSSRTAVEVRGEVWAHVALHRGDGLQGIRYTREQALRVLLPWKNGVLSVQSRIGDVLLMCLRGASRRRARNGFWFRLEMVVAIEHDAG